MKKRVVSVLMTTLLACGMWTGTVYAADAAEENADAAKELDPSDDAISAAKGKTFAYVTPSTTTPYWNWVEDGVQAQCDEYGIELIVYDSKDDSATQLSNVQNAITRGVDGIIISPTDSASCPAAQDEAESADVPLVVCDVGSDEDNYLTYVSTDNYGGAKAVGEYLGEYMKDKGLEGSIGEITIPLSRINGQKRSSGFADGLAESGYEVSTVLESSDYTMDEADGQARNIATANPDLIAIFANHDAATNGTMAALDDLGLGADAGDDQVFVASFDGSTECVEALKNGECLVCGAQQAKNLGKQSVKAIAMDLNDEEVAKQVLLDVVLLTADNVNDYTDFIEENVCTVE